MTATTDVILDVQNLVKHFPVLGGGRVCQVHWRGPGRGRRELYHLSWGDPRPGGRVGLR